MIQTRDPAPPARGATRPLSIRVRDVTGSHSARLTDVDPTLRVGTIAETVAARLSLPVDGTPWTLRVEETARYLDDVAIGDALGVDANVEAELVLAPRAHLGGA